jgi:hypothetical protein
VHRADEVRLDHLDHVHIVARSHFACVASVRSRTDSRVTAVVAVSAAMVVATVLLTVPRRSLLGCHSVPVAPQRTHVSTLVSRETCRGQQRRWWRRRRQPPPVEARG